MNTQLSKFPAIFDEDNYLLSLQGEGSDVVGISGCIHGNERIGLEVIRKIATQKHDRSQYKTLHLIGGNPRAYQANKRFIEANLNRVNGDSALIPESMSKSYERKIAIRLEKIFRECDKLLDIHQAFSDDDFIVCKKASLPLAKSMASPRIVISPELEHYTEQKGIAVSSTDHFMNSIGKQGIVYEFGDMRSPDQTQNIEKAYQEALSFITNQASTNASQFVDVFRTKMAYVTREHYVSNPEIKPFSTLHTGQIIGTDGDHSITVKEDQDGWAFILGFPEQPIPGQEAFMIGEKSIESRI